MTSLKQRRFISEKLSLGNRRKMKRIEKRIEKGERAEKKSNIVIKGVKEQVDIKEVIKKIGREKNRKR